MWPPIHPDFPPTVQAKYEGILVAPGLMVAGTRPGRNAGSPPHPDSMPTPMSDPDFKIWFEDVQWQVDQLRSTPSGDELIRALAANYGLPDKTGQPLEENNWMSRESGHTAADISDVRVIVFPSDKRSHSVPMQRTNALGGEGTDSYLRYNPRQISALWDASGKFVTQHPTVALGHELIHALHASVGANPIDSTPLSTPLDTSAKGSGYTYKDAQIPLEELFTTGTPLDEAAAWRGLQIKKKFGLRLPPEDPDYSSSESESSESDTMARPMVGNPYLQNAVNEVEAHRITWHSEQAEWIVAHPDEAAKIEMRLNDIVTGRARVSLTNPTEQKIAEQLGFPTRERYLGSMVKALPGWSKPVNAIRYDLTAGTRPRDLTKEDLSDPQHSARLTMAATSRTECGVFAEGEDSADCVLTGDAPNAADPAKVRAEQAYLVRFSEKLAKIPATSALATIDEQVRPALPGILKDVSDTAIAKITDPIIRSQAEGIIRLDPASAPDGWEDRLKGIIGGEAGASALAYGAVFLAMGITNGSINTTNWYEVIGNFEPHIATALALYNVIRASTASHPDPYTIAQTVVQLVAAFSLLLAPVEIGVFFIIPAAMMITSVIDYYNADKQDVVTVHNLRDYRDKVWTKVLENVLGPAAKQYVTAYAAAYRTNLAISEIAYQYDVTHRQRTALEQANANPLQAGTILDTAQQTITAERDTLTAIYQHARDLLTSPVSSEANPWHTTTVTTLESPTTVATLTKTLFTQAWPSFNQAIKARHHADEKDCSETPGDYGYDDCLKETTPW